MGSQSSCSRPLAIAEAASVVEQAKCRAAQSWVYICMFSEIEHKSKLRRARVLGVLQCLILKLPARVILEDGLCGTKLTVRVR